MLPPEDLQALAAYLDGLECQDPEPLTQAPSAEVQRAQEERLLKAWKTPEGWRYWSEVNNSAVGLWYMAAAFGFFLFGGVLALLLRIQLAVPDNPLPVRRPLQSILYAARLGDDVSLRRTDLPGFSIMVLPQMLGGRDLPFPRLSAYGFWSFILGGSSSAARFSSMPPRKVVGSCTRR